jgi:hypothetical protein
MWLSDPYKLVDIAIIYAKITKSISRWYKGINTSKFYSRDML